MQEGKRKGQLEGEQGGKKQKTPNKQTLNNQVPQPLYQLRMAVQKHTPQTPISRVLRAGGSDIPKLLQATGVPTKTCCRFLFWGACGSAQCTLAHDHVQLTPEATDKAVAILQPGVDKILSQPASTA